MANKIYPKYKEALISGGSNVNLSSGTVKAVLIDAADYTYSDAHEFFSSVPSGARVGTPQTLGSKSVTNGVFDAADITFTAVSGDQSEALLIYIDTGNESTSRLVAYLDTGHDGLPVTPNGGDIEIKFNASGIFGL